MTDKKIDAIAGDGELARARARCAELEARVRQDVADLERANENLESFTHEVSHDLRAPLRALRGFSEALAEEYAGQLDETGSGYIERIKAASEHLTALLDGLLLLSRVSRADLVVRPVDLSAEAAAIADELRSAAPDRQVVFRIEEGARAMADRYLIRRVLQSLLENAWKFTSRRDEAVIEFGAAGHEGEGTHACWCVRDNGVGFDPAYTGKLFQPFQRLHGPREFPGAGIGLAAAQRAIERHGGHLRAEAAVGQGATFFFCLPGPAPGD